MARALPATTVVGASLRAPYREATTFPILSNGGMAGMDSGEISMSFESMRRRRVRNGPLCWLECVAQRSNRNGTQSEY